MYNIQLDNELIWYYTAMWLLLLSDEFINIDGFSQ